MHEHLIEQRRRTYRQHHRLELPARSGIVQLLLPPVVDVHRQHQAAREQRQQRQLTRRAQTGNDALSALDVIFTGQREHIGTVQLDGRLAPPLTLSPLPDFSS